MSCFISVLACLSDTSGAPVLTRPVLASSCFDGGSSVDTHPGGTGTSVLYQMRKRPFSSNSGSGYTALSGTWASPI